jgi:class 3 adenylate cyclase
MAETRRLAAILAADVVGYSRLMGEDEARTAKAVPGQGWRVSDQLYAPSRRDRAP